MKKNQTSPDQGGNPRRRAAGEITGRKQIETALRESTALLGSPARMSPVGIFRTDPKGNCVYVNELWCEVAGLTVEAALGEGWVKAIHPHDRHRVFEEWYRSAQEHRPFRSEYRFQRPDGLATSVLGQASAELDQTGEVVGYVGTVTDITEQKHAEEALREARDEIEHRVRERTAELFAANAKLTSVIIKVQDSSRGIPLEHQESILNPFFTTMATGTGLGQAVAQRIVTRLGGAGSFESTPDVGTAVWVELPTAPRA